MAERRAVRQASFKRNAAFAVAASLLTLLVNMALVGILPQALSIESYGFLQLYLLYSSFVGLAHLGLVDGVYLELGGQRLESVNRPLLTGLVILLGGSQLVLAMAVWATSSWWTTTPQEQGVWQAVAACVVVTNLRFFFLYVLQATASAAQAATCVIVDRGSYLVMIVTLAAADELSLFAAVICDLIAKCGSLICATAFCRRIFTRSWAGARFVMGQVPRLMRMGATLLLANLAGTAIIGAARIGVERTWSVREFAFVSLALGVALVGVGLLSSVGMALFPFLRRLPQSRLSEEFTLARSTLSPLLLLGLAAFVPLRWVMDAWLPEYSDSVVYLGLILPVVVFDGLFVLLTAQILRTLHLQRVLLFVNAGAVVASTILTVVGCLVIHRIEAVLLGLVVTLAVRSICADFVVRRYLKIGVSGVVVVEVILAGLFVGEVIVGSSLGWPPVVSTLAVLGYGIYALPRSRRAWDNRTPAQDVAE